MQRNAQPEKPIMNKKLIKIRHHAKDTSHLVRAGLSLWGTLGHSFWWRLLTSAPNPCVKLTLPSYLLTMTLTRRKRRKHNIKYVVMVLAAGHND